MKKVMTLTKILFKNTSSQFNIKSKNKSSKIGIIALICYVAIIFGYLSYQIVKLLIAYNQPVIFIGILLLLIAMLVIFQTIFSGISIFYMSKDIEYLLPMPISTKELLMAKFNTLLITEYIVELIFTVVPIMVYGMLTSAGIVFYIYALLILFLFPIFPAAIASLIMVVIMSFSKHTKNKDKFTVIVTILSIVFAIWIQLSSMSNVEFTDEQMMQKFIELNGTVDVIGEYFITIQPALETLANYNNMFGILSLLKLLAITFISYLLFIMLGNKLYLKGAIRSNFKYGQCSKKTYKRKKSI